MSQAEKAEKERKKKEKQEAHLYTIIKVARDQDFFDQIGSTQFFDLVDHDKVKVPWARCSAIACNTVLSSSSHSWSAVPRERASCQCSHSTPGSTTVSDCTSLRQPCGAEALLF